MALTPDAAAPPPDSSHENPTDAAPGTGADGVFAWLLALAALAAGAFSVATLVLVSHRGFVPMPWADALEHWRRFVLEGESWSLLFSQHNEHRIPLLRLAFRVDLALAGADGRFLTIATLFTQAASAAMLYRVAAGLTASRATRAFMLGLAFAICFAAGQSTNFTWTFQLCFVTVFTAGIAAIVALGNSTTAAGDGSIHVSAPWVALAIGMALLSTGSMANGLLIWPVLALMSIVMRLPRRYTALIVATGGATFAAYMFGYVSDPRPPRPPLARLAAEVTIYGLTYLGSAVDEPARVVSRALGIDWVPYRIPVAASVGAVGALAFAWLVVQVRRVRQAISSRTVLIAILTFLTLSAALTAIGRIHLGLESALTDRYATPSLLFWATLLLTASASPRRLVRVLLLAPAVFVGGSTQLTKIDYAAEMNAYLTEGESAFINDVYAADAWGRFYYAPGVVVPIVRYFRTHDLGTFRAEWTHWRGQPASDHYQLVDRMQCSGRWEGIVRIPGTFKPAVLGYGWGYDLQFRRAPRLFVFTSPDGRIVGFAIPTRMRPDLAEQRRVARGARVGWHAYFPAGPVPVLHAYALLADERSLCPIGSIQLPEPFTPLPLDKAGAPIGGARVEVSGTWTREPAPGAEGEELPGAWSSRTVTTEKGTLRLGPVHLAAGTMIGLPVMSGAEARDVVVKVVEHTTGDVLEEINLPAGVTRWMLFPFALPQYAPAMTVDFLVADTSSSPGDWVAVGPPRLIQ